MKTNLLKLFLPLLFISPTLSAQDLIVTKKNDSINCKINKIETNLITFQYKPQTEIIETLIATSQVAYIQKNFFKDNPNITDSSNDQSSKFKISLSGGLSYRTAALPPNLTPDAKKHLQDQTWGNHINFDATYYIDNNNGLGFKYFKSNYNASNFIYETNAYYLLSEDVTIQFIGPFYSIKNTNHKNTLYYNIGFGYLKYNDNITINTTNSYTATGSNAGLLLELGYDYALSKNVAIGTSATFVGGHISEFSLAGSSLAANENLSHLNLSAGIKFSL